LTVKCLPCEELVIPVPQKKQIVRLIVREPEQM